MKRRYGDRNSPLSPSLVVSSLSVLAPWRFPELWFDLVNSLSYALALACFRIYATYTDIEY